MKTNITQHTKAVTALAGEIVRDANAAARTAAEIAADSRIHPASRPIVQAELTQQTRARQAPQFARVRAELAAMQQDAVRPLSDNRPSSDAAASWIAGQCSLVPHLNENALAAFVQGASARGDVALLSAVAPYVTSKMESDKRFAGSSAMLHASVAMAEVLRTPEVVEREAAAAYVQQLETEVAALEQAVNHDRPSEALATYAETGAFKTILPSMDGAA